jgi:hypothetical protein
MPRLKQRSDGCYYIVHFHDDYGTWQLDRDGVKFLETAKVAVDDLFPTDLFMEMWNRKLIYVGQHREEYWKSRAPSEFE